MNIYQQDGTLHAMDSHSPSASHYRDGRLVVSRQGRDAIRTINRSFEEISRLAKAKNPSAATPPPVSGMVSVHDQGTRSQHLVFVHYLDHQSPLAPAVGNIVAFSEPSFLPPFARRISNSPRLPITEIRKTSSLESVTVTMVPSPRTPPVGPGRLYSPGTSRGQT